MTEPSTEHQQLQRAQAHLAQQEEEIQRLQKIIDQQQHDINRLQQWLEGLKRDIADIYASVTWLIGDTTAKIILKLLRRPVGITARDHIDRILFSYHAWKEKQQKDTTLQTLPWHDTVEYHAWLKQYPLVAPTVSNIDTPPTFHFLITCQHNTNLSATLDSLKKQTIPHWHAHVLLEENKSYPTTHPQITLYPQSKQNVFFNACLQQITSGFIAALHYGDCLHEQSCAYLIQHLQQYPNHQLIYTDEDKITAQGYRFDPYFKPDWSPDLYYSQYYIQHLCCYAVPAVKNWAGNEAQELFYALSLHCIATLEPEMIGHISTVLYHRHEENENVQNPIRQALLNQHFQHQACAVKIHCDQTQQFHLRYPLPEKLPLVSIIIPTRDGVELLKTTVTGLLKETSYPHIEIIIMDNGSVEKETLHYFSSLAAYDNIKIISHAKPFNYSELNNIGATHATGEILALLNNDLKMIHSDWLEEMVAHALRPDVGAVGAKLYYADDTIQHAGVTTGLGGVAGHSFKFTPRHLTGDHKKLYATHNVSVVTGACLVLRRTVFEELGGLNEKDLKVAFNDVDLCLRIRQQGYLIVWTPHAELYHLESVSRGVDNTPQKFLRLRHEINYIREQWGNVLADDPYYNPNLTISYEDHSLAYPPRLQ